MLGVNRDDDSDGFGALLGRDAVPPVGRRRLAFGDVEHGANQRSDIPLEVVVLSARPQGPLQRSARLRRPTGLQVSGDVLAIGADVADHCHLHDNERLRRLARPSFRCSSIDAVDADDRSAGEGGLRANSPALMLGRVDFEWVELI